MGNQNSDSSQDFYSSGTNPDNPELFRKQSIRKSSIGYGLSGGPSSNLTRAKKFMERDLNKSHSLHDLDAGSAPGTKKSSYAKNRRQSTTNDGLGSGSRKRSTVLRPNGIATNISANNSSCNSRASPAPPFAGGLGYGDTEEDQYINGFGSTMASSSSPNASGSVHHARTSSTPSSVAAGASSTGTTRQKSIKKSEIAPHPITVSGREIIQFCFENAPLDFGTRLCTRIYEKRADYQRFSQQMGREKWYEMTHGLRDFLQRAIAKIDNLEAVEKIARKYGEDHLALKTYGFKPDFWVTLADLLTVEGVMLDQATHTHTDAVTAWSLFISILFSSIRDGYYSAMREQRNSVRKRSNARQPSVGGQLESAIVAGLQKLQIPSAADCAGGSHSASSSPYSQHSGSATPNFSASDLAALSGQSQHNSSARVGSATSSRKSSMIEQINRRQSPHR